MGPYIIMALGKAADEKLSPEIPNLYGGSTNLVLPGLEHELALYLLKDLWVLLLYRGSCGLV